MLFGVVGKTLPEETASLEPRKNDCYAGAKEERREDQG